jgi:hypothetical protein
MEFLPEISSQNGEKNEISILFLFLIQVGMRTFHHKRNLDFCPSINVDRLWSMVPEGVYEKAKTDSSMAPVIDVTKLVS